MNHLARALISAVSSHGRSSYPVKWSNLDAAAAAVVDDDDDDDDDGGGVGGEGDGDGDGSRSGTSSHMW